MYAHVVNGAVQEVVSALPEVLGNVSGFNLLSADELAAQGWLPVSESNPAYDPTTQRRTGVSYAVSGNSVTATYTLEDIAASEVVEPFHAQIDSEADLAALRHVTGGQTQGARYQRKLANCQAYKSANYPNSADASTIDQAAYPFVYQEATQTGQTGQQVADGVIQQALDWDVLAAQIEGIRVGGKNKVTAAGTAAAAITARDDAVNALKAI